ncbi:MAG: (2Fe-2S) ferredoxin domain-containing protein [Chitinispirillaceae bacterium]
MDKKEIVICMGSSCYSRGNGRNHGTIMKFLEENGCDAQVGIKGCRCGGHCMNGPNIWINGDLFTNIDRGSLLDILNHTLGSSQKEEA